METAKLTPPVYLLLAIIGAILLNFSLPGLTLIAFPWTLFGILPVLAGLALSLSADRAFQQVETSVNPFEMPSALVTGGLYRYTRNPMYLGFILILTGTAILLGSLTPFFIIPAFWVLLDRGFISLEEQNLALKFVARWDMYKSRTRRWL